MNILDKYKFSLKIPPSEVFEEVQPLNNDLEFQFDINKPQVKIKLNTRLTFASNVAKLIQQWDRSLNRCLPIELELEPFCAPTKKTKYYAKPFDCTFDLSNCITTVQFTQNDVYDCLEKRMNKEYTFTDRLPNYDLYLNYKTTDGGSTIENLFAVSQIGDGTGEQPTGELGYIYYDNSTALDVRDGQGWVAVQTNYTSIAPEPPLPGTWQVNTWWSREKYTGATAPIGDNWIQISPTEWVRPVDANDGESSLYDILNLKFGYKLNDLIEYLFGASVFDQDGAEFYGAQWDLDCLFIVKSDFFGINAPNTAPTNDPYTECEKLKDLLIFQKSDVLRRKIFDNPPNTWQKANPKIKASDLLNDLKTDFNIVWWVEENMTNEAHPIAGNIQLEGKPILRIEHISYFEEKRMLDLRKERFSAYLLGNNEYSYKKEELVYKEVFNWQEKTDNTSDFDGLPILYNASCSDTTRENTYQNALLMTNVKYLINKIPTISTATSIEEFKGFLLVATNFDTQDNKYYVDYEAGKISNTLKQNGHLSFANLHEAYHKYNRLQKTANMNGNDKNMASWKRNRQAKEISIPLCCDDFWGIFSPNDLVRNQYGWGEVESANYKEPIGFLTLKINNDGV